MFLSSDARERAKFIRDTANALRKDLRTNPTVVKYLGVSAVELIWHNLGNLQPVNVKGGEVRLPRHMAPTAIPILAIHTGEELRLNVDDFGTLSPAQGRTARRQIERWSNPKTPPHIIDAALREVGTALKSPQPGEANTGIIKGEKSRLGFVEGYLPTVDLAKPLGPWHNLGKEDTRGVFGRPLVGLLTDTESNDPPEITLVHELWHHESKEAAPLYRLDRFDDATLREELECRHIGAQYELALYHTGDPRFQGDDAPFTEWDVEKVRLDNIVSKRDPFKPTGTIRKALAEQGIEL